MSKEITIKSFDSNNTYIKNITDATFDGFRKNINGGLSDLTLRLARKIDDFNGNDDVSIGNKIEIWVHDEDSGSAGINVYTGYIEQQNIEIDGGVEYVEIVCLGIVSKLKLDVLKSSSQTKLYTIATTGLTTTSASRTAAEIADVIKAVIDQYNTVNDSHIYYDNSGSTIYDTGNDMNYIFEAMIYFDALEKCRDASPQNWYWFIGADETVYFRAISTTADHELSISKHIKRISASKSADSIKNIMLLWDGQTGGNYRQYKDDVSIALYGRRVEQKTDSNIKDTGTMDNIGNSFIAENKDPKIRLEIEIIDNNESDKGYDIESIDPGDTCKIVGVDADENIFNDNMIIKEVRWELGRAILTVETENSYDIDRFILKLNKNLSETIISGIPESYT